MKFRLAIAMLLLLGLCPGVLNAQGYNVAFTSQTDAHFFLFLNGKQKNTKSTGELVLKNLKHKKYHVRIVMDDPYEVATTLTIKPTKKKNHYYVRFNPLRERVYVTSKRDEENTQDDVYNNIQFTTPSLEQTAEKDTVAPPPPQFKKHAKINGIKEKYIEE